MSFRDSHVSYNLPYFLFWFGLVNIFSLYSINTINSLGGAGDCAREINSLLESTPRRYKSSQAPAHPFHRTVIQLTARAPQPPPASWSKWHFPLLFAATLSATDLNNIEPVNAYVQRLSKKNDDLFGFITDSAKNIDHLRSCLHL